MIIIARTIVTDELILEINRLYLEIKTYAGVSRALGGSPAPTTIKKYIIPDFSICDKEKILFSLEDIKPIDSSMFNRENWGELLEYQPNEFEEIKVLWKELVR